MSWENLFLPGGISQQAGSSGPSSGQLDSLSLWRPLVYCGPFISSSIAWLLWTQFRVTCATTEHWGELYCVSKSLGSHSQAAVYLIFFLTWVGTVTLCHTFVWSGCELAVPLDLLSCDQGAFAEWQEDGAVQDFHTSLSFSGCLSVAKTSGSSLVVVHNWLCQKTMEVLILTITSNTILERSFNAESLAFVTVIKINSNCVWACFLNLTQ